MFRDLLSRRDLKFKLKHNRVIGNSDTPSGSTGIPTIDKNTQPNIVRSDATDGDKAKFVTSPIISVVDIQDGKLPLFMVVSIPINPGDPSAESITLGASLTNVTFPTEDNDGTVRYGDESIGVLFYISRDWTLLGIQGMV